MMYKDYYTSPIGKMILLSENDLLTGLYFDSEKRLNVILEKEPCFHNLPIFAKTKEWLDIYFSGKNPPFTVPIKLIGSDFRLSVWEILKNIPYGATITYKDIAIKIARQRQIEKMSAQAVGNAVGHNPISIIIPCHRVVGTNGNLTGYAGGLAKKIALLKLEGVNMHRLFLPKVKDS